MSSLDQSDNDPALFWAYFITALQTVQSEVGESALSFAVFASASTDRDVARDS